jgi:curli biogenesis system outer membrane secretion channel CsgG
MRKLFTILALGGLLLTAGCGGMGTTRFIHPEFDFGFLESVAVVPFENASENQGAGNQATRYFNNALLATEAFEIVEPGEVARVLENEGLVRTAQLSDQQIVAIGQQLGVQGLFLGSVTESSSIRSGATTVSVVTVVIRLVETETGATVWSATGSDDSATFWSSLFGTGQRARADVMRRAIDKCLGSLMD